MRCAILRMNDMSCSTTISGCVELMSLMISAVRMVSSSVIPAAGSSSRMTVGLHRGRSELDPLSLAVGELTDKLVDKRTKRKPPDLRLHR